MKKLITIAAFVLGTSYFCNIAQAQTKFGYINSAELMQLMPETKKANAELETLVKTLEDQLEKMKTELNDKYKAFLKDEKTMSEAIKEVKQSELQNGNDNLQNFSQKAQDQIEDKKRKLLDPIMDKAQKAIEEVAKANNIAYVFDMTSTGILVAPPGDDMLPLLKAKLMIKDTPAPAAPKPITPKK
jgi:outer membrane protein